MSVAEKSGKHKQYIFSSFAARKLSVFLSADLPHKGEYIDSLKKTLKTPGHIG